MDTWFYLNPFVFITNLILPLIMSFFPLKKYVFPLVSKQGNRLRRNIFVTIFIEFLLFILTSIFVTVAAFVFIDGLGAGLLSAILLSSFLIGYLFIAILAILFLCWEQIYEKYNVRSKLNKTNLLIVVLIMIIVELILQLTQV